MMSQVHFYWLNVKSSPRPFTTYLPRLLFPGLERVVFSRKYGPVFGRFGHTDYFVEGEALGVRVDVGDNKGG